MGLILTRPRAAPSGASIPTGKAPVAASTAAATDRPVLEIQAERRFEQLTERVKELEQFILAENPAAHPVQGSLADLRGKFRRLHQLYKGTEGDAKVDADENEESILWMQCEQEFLHPARRPGRYVKALQAFYEAVLEELGAPLRAEQQERLSHLLSEVEKTLAAIPPKPGSERLIRELETERDSKSRVLGILDTEQRRLFQQDNQLGEFSATSYSSIERKSWEQYVPMQWQSKFKLLPEQTAAATAAAKALLQELDSIDREFTLRTGSKVSVGASGDVGCEYRIRCIRAQMEALRQLEGVMSPAQWEMMQAAEFQEYHVYDPPPQKR